MMIVIIYTHRVKASYCDFTAPTICSDVIFTQIYLAFNKKLHSNSNSV